jgi:GNAT superfamily N-acetyltransferase
MASTDFGEGRLFEPIIEHPLGTAYLPGLLELSRAANWNQDEADWRHMLSAGVGWGRSLPDGTVVASTVVLPYAPAVPADQGFGWISMVLVLPDHRRHGHASRLLTLATGWLRNRGLTPILDATPAGRAVYLRQGFRDTWGFERWMRGAGAASGSPRAAPGAGPTAGADPGSDAGPDRAAVTVRDLAGEDWPAVLALDAAAFGGDRADLLRSLAARLPGAARVAVRGSRTVGAVFGRPGREAVQLGPLLAHDDDVATALLDAALAALPGPVFADAPVAHAGFGHALAARGFERQRPFTRMVRDPDGPPRAPGRPDGLRLVAGPELG